MSAAPPAAAEAVRIDGLRVDYEAEGQRVQALHDLSLVVREAEFVAIVGPSGCGKSTLLNVLVGTLPPTSGSVSVHGAPVAGINHNIGYVTQDDNLLPWRTLLGNVELPLALRGVSRAERRRRAEALLARVELSGFESRFPFELSGGMRQRANIIRALIYDPALIVMDEPFGSLDAFTRAKMQRLVLDLWESARKTVLFITHDLDEAIVLADRIVVLSRRPGRLKGEVIVDLPRPRDTFALKTTAAFHDCFNEVWSLLAEEVMGDQ